MKHLLLLITLFITTATFAQTDTLVFSSPEVMPSFPGGETEMAKFINANLAYPEAEKKAKISGTCFLSFVVEKDGAVTNPQLLRGVKDCQSCDAEAFRIVGLMPKWNPGKQNGMEVRTKMNMPIKFMILEFNRLSLNDTAFYSYNDLCAREDAVYYRTATKLDKGYLVKETRVKGNHLYMEAVCSSLNPLVKNGNCIIYRDTENQSKLEEGLYEEDKQVGAWTIWEKENEDSLVVEYFKDGMYKNKFVPAHHKDNIEMNVLYKVEEMPVFVGGEYQRMMFFQNNMKYPIAERDKGIQGTCYISFVIEKDGSLTDIEVVKGVKGGAGLDAEALRVVKLMPSWTPGKQYGTRVRVQFNLPVKFTMR